MQTESWATRLMADYLLQLSDTQRQLERDFKHKTQHKLGF